MKRALVAMLLVSGCSSSFDPKTLVGTPCPFTAPVDAGAEP